MCKKWAIVLVLLISAGCGTTRSLKVDVTGGNLGLHVSADFYEPQQKETANPVTQQKDNGGFITQLPVISKTPIDNNWKDITSKFKFWDVEGEGVVVENDHISISSSKGRGAVFIKSQKINVPGTYKMVAMVKAIDIVRVGTKNYERGKFQAVIFESEREVDWPDSDFEGNHDWQTKSVEGRISDRSESLLFRIGLQRASGTVLVRDIHISQKQ